MLSALPSAKIEVFIGRHGDAWRLYTHGWVAPFLKQKLDRHGEAFPVGEPDLADLEEYMWGLDAPYLVQTSTAGGVAIEAKGRSAVALWEWLDEHLSTSKLER